MTPEEVKAEWQDALSEEKERRDKAMANRLNNAFTLCYTEEGKMSDNWKHRSENMRCHTCMWFVEKVIKLDGYLEGRSTVAGRCRRHAPTMNGYPARFVFPTDWCGDHKLDENKV